MSMSFNEHSIFMVHIRLAVGYVFPFSLFSCGLDNRTSFGAQLEAWMLFYGWLDESSSGVVARYPKYLIFRESIQDMSLFGGN